MEKPKNVLDDLWIEWDYENLEQHYFQIKRAEVRASEKELTEEDRKNFHEKILDTLTGYNMKIYHPENVKENLDLLNKTFRGHHNFFEIGRKEGEFEECPDGSCSPQEYRWKKHLLKSLGFIDDYGRPVERIDLSQSKPDFSILTEDERNSQIEKNRENNLDDLWDDWENENVEQRYYELKRAETRLPYCVCIHDSDEFLLEKAREVARELGLFYQEDYSFKHILKQLDQYFYAAKPSLSNLNFHLPFSYTRSDWPAAVYREYIWRKLLLSSKDIFEDPDSRWGIPTCPPDFIWITFHGFNRQKKSLLRPFWKNWHEKTLEEQAEIIKIIYVLIEGLLLSEQDIHLLFEREFEVNRKLHPEKHRPLRIATREEIRERVRRVGEIENRIKEHMAPNDKLMMTPDLSPFCEADKEEEEFDLDKAVEYFEDVMGMDPWAPKPKN